MNDESESDNTSSFQTHLTQLEEEAIFHMRKSTNTRTYNFSVSFDLILIANFSTILSLLLLLLSSFSLLLHMVPPVIKVLILIFVNVYILISSLPNDKFELC
jgi:hypothetical protein